MKLILFLFAFTIVTSKMLFCQDTVIVYFDKDWNEISNKDFAIYYRNAFEDRNKTWIVNDYFMSSKQIQMSGSYKSKKQKVRHGNFIYYYENGQIQSEGFVLKNKNDGVWNYWHENGEKESEGVYVNGNYEGVWISYYDNGAKKSEGKYISGLAAGIWVYWHDSGEKKAEGKYFNGKKDGIWNYWYTNGQLSSVETFLNGNITSAIGYFENGKNSFKGNYFRGLMQNEWTYWNVDGRVTFKGSFNNGYKNGEWIRYFPEGGMKLVYKNGVLQGNSLGGIVKFE